MKSLPKGHRNQGFTIVELMITVAIVAILVAMAVPAYKDYSIRSKIAECINGAAVAKLQISEYRQSMGPWPPTAQDAGLDINASGVSTFCDGFTNYAPLTGSFTIDIDETVVDSALGTVEPRLTPSVNTSNVINWECTVGNTPAANVKYLPANCRDSET